MNIKLESKWIRVGWFSTQCKRIYQDISEKNREVIRKFNHSFGSKTQGKKPQQYTLPKHIARHLKMLQNPKPTKHIQY